MKILGQKIDSFIDYQTAINELKVLIDKYQNGYITVNNVHTIIEAVLNPKFKEIINNSTLSLADGKPLSIYAKLRGDNSVSRIFGPTFFEKTIEWGQKEELKHFFFGGSKTTLQMMYDNIASKYPAAIIAGSYSPPYKNSFSIEENKRFLNLMNKSGADIFWIGLGAPKQEMWMYENYEKLNRGVMIGIGAGFDYLSGRTKHAPKWMKNFALEWFYRLIQEPRRLWKRYLITNTLFLWYVILEFLRIKKF